MGGSQPQAPLPLQPELSHLADLGQLQGDPESSVSSAARVSAQQVALLARAQVQTRSPRLFRFIRHHSYPTRPHPLYDDSPFLRRSLAGRWSSPEPR